MLAFVCMSYVFSLHFYDELVLARLHDLLQVLLIGLKLVCSGAGGCAVASLLDGIFVLHL